MKKILNILVIISIVFINNSCKKNNIDIVDKTSAIFNKFYNSTENTKPVVKKIMEQIKQSGRYNDLEKFATKYGFPKWDKALIHPKNEMQLDDDSSAAEEYVIIPTVLENDNKVNGFIAVETTVNGINFQTYLGTDYKRFPYESTTTTGATAELMVGILLALEHETFGYEKFGINDSQLSFYRTPQNSGDIALLEIKPEQTLNSEIVTCYIYQNWGIDNNGNHFTIGPPVLLFCISEITNLPAPGSGGGSAPPPYNNDYELCKRNFDDFAAQGFATSEDLGQNLISETSTEKRKDYWWCMYSWGFGAWKLVSRETGILEKDLNPPDPSLKWRWKSLTHDYISHMGIALGGNISYKELKNEVIMGVYTAGVKIEYEIEFSALCKGSPLSISYVIPQGSPTWDAN